MITLGSTSRSCSALAACALSVFALGCAAGGAGNHNITPLSTTVLNRTYRLTSASNTAHIAAFVGPIHNSAPHAQIGADYYSDADATFTIVSDGTASPCMDQPFTLTGRLTNPVEGNVYIDLSGDVAGGTMTLSGQVKNANQQTSGTITGTYKIAGGRCQVEETNFVAVEDGQQP